MTTETTTAPAKPLTGREQRNLEKLIKEDFGTAYRELSGQHDDFVRDALAEVEREYVPSQQVMSELLDEATQLELRLKQEVEDFLARARSKGYGQNLAAGYNRHEGYTVSINKKFERTGRSEAQTAVRLNAQAAMDQARRAIQDGESEALRQVLLATIDSSAAKALLASVPTAGAVFQEAAQAITTGKSDG